MRFYQLWEEITNSNFNAEILQNIAQSIFGACERAGDNIDCTFKNRYLEFEYFKPLNSVYIAFMWKRQPEVLSKRNKEFDTSVQLQQGSVEGMHKFIEFAKKLKEYNVRIDFSTDGKRKVLYDKVLTSAGYKNAGPYTYVPA